MNGSAYNKKKRPEDVRRRLVESTARLVVELTAGSLTIQSVADAAGVTKGGLLHHFPDKQTLFQAVMEELLEQLDVEIDRELSNDHGGHGTFTRSYVRAMFADRALGSRSPWAALTMYFIAEPAPVRLWQQWIKRRLAKHNETDAGSLLQVVRLAADGAWLEHVSRPPADMSDDDKPLRQQLLALTEIAADSS